MKSRTLAPRLTQRPLGSLVRSALRNKWVLRAAVVVLFLSTWQILAAIKGPFFLPTVPALAEGMGNIFSEGYYLTMLESLRQLIIGFAVALAIGIPIGALMGSSRLFNDVVQPYVNALFVTPQVALLPLVIILVGTDLEYRVFIVVIFAVFFPAINTAAGVRMIDRGVLEMSASLCTSRVRTVFRVMIPAAAPFVVAGIRLSLGMAIKGMVIAELWITAGTGGLLRSFGTARALPEYFSIAILIILVAVVGNWLLLVAERRLRPWEKVRVLG